MNELTRVTLFAERNKIIEELGKGEMGEKGGDVLCRIEGELSDYQARGLADLMADPEVPDKPTLKLKRNPQEKA